jgi:hypothetical protein
VLEPINKPAATTGWISKAKLQRVVFRLNFMGLGLIYERAVRLPQRRHLRLRGADQRAGTLLKTDHFAMV